MRDQIQSTIDSVVRSLYGPQKPATLSHPDAQFGDYATNVALVVGAKLGKNPSEIAQSIVDKFHQNLPPEIAQISVNNNFINIKLSDLALMTAAQNAAEYRPNTYSNQVVVAEYSDPNPFKMLHVGHLYTSVLGDSIANLLELGGGQVHRVNFGGDVGLHVAKSLWSMLNDSPDGSDSEAAALKVVNSLDIKALSQKAAWLSDHYIRGSAEYELDEPETKKAIQELNKQIYAIQEHDMHDTSLAQIYWTTRQWSYDYFAAFYREIDIHPFEKFYPESQTAPIGVKTVMEQLKKGVYELSQGAVIFKGEKFGLHTRVFINSNGLPTYETKDVGLILLKWKDFKFDKSIIITDSNQAEYQRVVQKSIEQFMPELARGSSHITHGSVKLKGGVKMSSRSGNVVSAADVLQATAKANKELVGDSAKLTTLGAIKYAFLKHRPGADIVYDPEESVSLVGNSGPYLQYAYARAQSILAKVKAGDEPNTDVDLNPDELSLVRKISQYPDALDRAVEDLMPHHISTYLYSLAQIFNSFYENNRVAGDPREALRAKMVSSYATTLKSGLELLHISVVDHL